MFPNLTVCGQKAGNYPLFTGGIEPYGDDPVDQYYVRVGVKLAQYYGINFTNVDLLNTIGTFDDVRNYVSNLAKAPHNCILYN